MRKEMDCVFRPSREELIKARERRMERWAALKNQSCSREDQLERMKADVEVFESMKTVRERVNKCIKDLKRQPQSLMEA